MVSCLSFRVSWLDPNWGEPEPIGCVVYMYICMYMYVWYVIRPSQCAYVCKSMCMKGWRLTKVCSCRKERHSHAAVEDSARDNDESAEARDARLARQRVLDIAWHAAQSSNQQARRRALDTAQCAAQSGRSDFCSITSTQARPTMPCIRLVIHTCRRHPCRHISLPTLYCAHMVR